jgi:hypothetical protein
MMPWYPYMFYPYAFRGLPFLPIPIAPISGGDPFLDFELPQQQQGHVPIWGPAMQQEMLKWLQPQQQPQFTPYYPMPTPTTPQQYYPLPTPTTQPHHPAPTAPMHYHQRSN